MRVDVYPTHRTVALPQRVLDNTLKNATGAKTVDGGVALENVLPGYPFPIPKTGSEAMWNHLLRYSGLGYDGSSTRTGTSTRPACRRSPSRPTRTGRGRSTTRRRPASIKRDRSVLATSSSTTSGRRAATARRCWSIDAVNPLKQPRRAWQYLPGQRRVKLAPDLAYDTPNPGAAGAATYDDVSVFNGAIDRFDWKLVGKKEMYVPYSSYRLTYHKDRGGRHEAEPPQSRTSCAGSCIASGSSRRR